MSDIKDTIFKILFEEEPGDDTPDVGKQKTENLEKVFKPKNKENIQSPRASDILYGKQAKSSSFIDYFPKEEDKEVKDEDQYEMRENVSPIFGLIDQKPKKKKAASPKEISKAISNNSKDGDYSGVVLSPIYGYDDSKANDARKVLASKDIKDEIHDDYIDEYDDDLPFEMIGQENDDVKVMPIDEEEEFEQVETLKQEAAEDRFEDDFFSYRTDETTQEITKEDVENAFRKIQDESNDESVYDTTPIRLFDVDSKDETREAVDDLFSDLSGDKD